MFKSRLLLLFIFFSLGLQQARADLPICDSNLYSSLSEHIASYPILLADGSKAWVHEGNVVTIDGELAPAGVYISEDGSTTFIISEQGKLSDPIKRIEKSDDEPDNEDSSEQYSND